MSINNFESIDKITNQNALIQWLSILDFTKYFQIQHEPGLRAQFIFSKPTADTSHPQQNSFIFVEIFLFSAPQMMINKNGNKAFVSFTFRETKRKKNLNLSMVSDSPQKKTLPVYTFLIWISLFCPFIWVVYCILS